MPDFYLGRYLKQNRTKSDRVGRYVRKKQTSDNIREKIKEKMEHSYKKETKFVKFLLTFEKNYG